MSRSSSRSPGAVSTRSALKGSALFVVGGFVVTALAWPELPQEMVVRWDASGTPDGTASRTIGALLLPAVAAVVVGVLELVPRIDPLGANFERFRGYYNGFVLLMVAFLIGIHGAVLARNLGYEFPLTTVVLGCVGVLFVYSSLLLRVAEPNWFVGIRTPWTLSSEIVWRKTHAVGSLIMGALGVVTVALSAVGLFVDIGELQVTVLAGGSFLLAAVSFGYSYYVYRKLEGPDGQAKTRRKRRS